MSYLTTMLICRAISTPWRKRAHRLGYRALMQLVDRGLVLRSSWAPVLSPRGLFRPATS
jgi:hypothetical protein